MDSEVSKALANVIELSHDATFGEWRVSDQPEEIGVDVWSVADCGGAAESGHPVRVVADIADYCMAAEDDAAFIVAAANFVRDYGEALQVPQLPDYDDDAVERAEEAYREAIAGMGLAPPAWDSLAPMRAAVAALGRKP